MKIIIKLWNINKCECLLNLNNVNNTGQIYSACFLKDGINSYNYIVTSNYNYFNESEPIKIFYFNGNKIKEINDSNEDVYIIKTYYDKKIFTNYIISGNNGSVYSIKINYIINIMIIIMKYIEM